MLVKITTQCSMGCTHCMEDALPQGEHMSLEVFEKALSFIAKCYPGVRIVMLSGGEPTEHPDILKIIELVKEWNVVLLSNGLFYTGPLKDSILDSGIAIQVYNDSRYYPKKVAPINHPNVIYADKINLMSPFGRAKKNGLPSGRTFIHEMQQMRS
jgi:MoaA/NifB/PqqE/SkfB family radical SAM enzyme